MFLSNLTNREKIVFANLIEHPNLTDVGLAKLTGIKRSTITSIRNRLKSGGYYETKFVPNLPAIGCKLIGFMSIKYSSNATRQIRSQSAAFEATVKHPELVYARSTDTVAIGLYCGKDLYDLRKVQDFLIRDYEARGFIESVSMAYYPIEMSDIYSFLNYGPFLKRLLGLESVTQQPSAWKGAKEVNLTNTEKLVLSSIVKWPEANNMELSRKIKKTRATVSKIKTELVERGLAKMINIPITAKLGCELVTYLYMKFNPKCPLPIRKSGIGLLLKEAVPILDVSGHTEASSIWISKNYTEYTETHNKVIGYFKENDYLAENPFIVLLPLNQLKWRKLDFSPLTDKLLFGKE